MRRQAHREGLPWPEVKACYEMLRETEHQKRELPNQVRAAAWQMATASTPACWPFWRHGFRARYGARVDAHDYSAIPGYDEIHQQIQTAFGQYTDDDGERRLFDFLMSPYDKLPTARELYDQAFAMVEDSATIGGDESPAEYIESEFV